MAISDFAAYADEISAGLGIVSELEGVPISLAVVEEALKRMGIKIARNTLLQRDEITGLSNEYSSGNLSNVLPVLIVDFLKREKVIGATTQRVSDYLLCIADKRRYNPVEVYLKMDNWDGEDRFTDLCDILGLCEKRHRTYVRKWMLQCIALGLNDERFPIGGEGVLTLCGKQGCGKTSFFRIICPFPEWFVEGASLDLNVKDSQIAALSGWICELGELDSTLKREQSSLKAFLTRSSDSIRFPYAKAATTTPRRTSFAATVNDSAFLLDQTGSRRFWVVPADNINKHGLFSYEEDKGGKKKIHQIWLQLYSEYLDDKGGFRLTPDEMEQLQIENRSYEVPVQYQPEIMSLLNVGLPGDRWEWWRSSDLAKILPGVPDSRRVGKALGVVCRNLKSSTRTLHGNKEYLIPLLHSGYGLTETG